MAVTRFNGSIYISEVETEKAEFDRKHRSPRQKEMCYWGYRFEGYLTKPIHGMIKLVFRFVTIFNCNFPASKVSIVIYLSVVFLG